MVRAVTDPKILKQLEGGDAQEVIDPGLLAQLEGKPKTTGFEEQSQPTDAMDYLSQQFQKIGKAEKKGAQRIGSGLAQILPGVSAEGARGLMGVEGKGSGAEQFIEQASSILPSLFLPGAALGRAGKVIESTPKIGKYLKAALSQAIPQSAYQASVASGDEGFEGSVKSGAETGAITAPFAMLSEAVRSASPALRTGGKIAGGLGAGALGYEGVESLGLPSSVAAPAALLAGYLGQRGMRPKKVAEQKVLEGIRPEDVQERLAASRRLGLDYLTPAEASLNPFAAQRQGGIGRTSEGSRMLYGRGEERIQSERKAINDLMNKIYDPEKLDAPTERLYKMAHEKSVPESYLATLTDNPVFQRAQRMVENKPAYQKSLENVPRDSIAYLDVIKQAMDDMIEKTPQKEARIIRGEKNKLVEQMDKMAPEYEMARSFAERGFVRDALEKAFDKKDITGQNFYKVLQSDKKFENMIRGLRNVPEAQEKLTDMKKLFNDLIGIPTVRSAAALEKTSMSKPRAFFQSLNDTLENLVGQSYDKAAIKLMTSPNWDETLANINQMQSKDRKMSALINALGKAAAQEGMPEN